MKSLKNKKGISLIVLILTIIVMIILATAIILSLNNSGIIGKANKAKRASDYASLKEYANVLRAEYELMSDAERTDYEDDIAYVNAKLEAEGYKERLNDDGILLKENTIEALEAGIEIGNEVKYTVTANKYTPDSSKTGTTNSELTAQTNLTWIYIGISEDGELLITPDVSNGVLANSDVSLYGKQGCLTGPDELNTICDKLYTTTKGTARSMNIDDVTRILGYTGEKGTYHHPTNGYAPTPEAKTISTLASEIGYDMEEEGFGTAVPETGKKIEDYYSDYYKIDKTASEDVNAMENSEYVDLIYPKSGYYWLASSCVNANFYDDYANFNVRYLGYSLVNAYYLFISDCTERGGTNTVRSVVSLTSKIHKNSATGNVVWEFVD